MIPLKIVMSAFGPFADKTEIDMRALGKSGVYLITGDTGAGKTTIFDAISFALYGEPSGNNRRNDMLRSDYAKPETPTFVTLLFEYNNKEYEITRNPDYTRLKKSGSGTTKENKSAELKMPDGSIISGWSQVNARVIELIGVERDRFNKIAMIAQGDFQKLLFADTKERMPLFRKVFGTQNYDRLQFEIKDKYFSVKTEYQKVSSRINDNINSVVCDESSNKFTALESIKQNGYAKYEDVTELIGAVISEDKTKQLSLDSEIEANDAAAAKLNSRLGAARALNEELERIGSAEKALALSLDECKAAASALETARQKCDSLKPHTERLNKINAAMHEYDEVQALATAIDELQKKSALLSRKIKEKEQSSEKIKAELDEQKALKSSEASVRTERIRLSHENENLTRKRDILKSLNSLLSEYSTVKNEAINAAKDYETASNTYKSARLEYDNKSKAYLDEQAGILAATLSDNAPCPVCGSIDHPSPAKLSSEAPDKKYIEKLKYECEAAEKQREKASELAGGLKQKANSLGGRITEQAKEVFNGYEQKKLPELIKTETLSVSQAVIQIEENIKLLDEKIEKIEKADKEIEKLNDSLATAEVEIKSCEQQLISAKASVGEKADQLEALRSRLEFSDKAEAVKAVTATQNEIDSAEKALTAAEKAYSDSSEKVTRLKGELAGLKTKKPTENVEELEKALADVTLAIENSRSTRDSIFSRIKANEKALSNIEKMIGELKSIKDEMICMERLYCTASGTVSGKMKLSLEAFVQAAYLDKILRKANLRLMKMSSGRYEMIRCTDIDKLNAQTGLEIDVIDHFTGCRRKVKSLSGGESFMASLSLALGLSDEIQSAAGGIHLDCLFIDEGFGSLDETTLSLAMNAFAGLSNGRLIGIISHVSELKERIDRKIAVEKSKTGSKVRVICN